MVINQIFNLPGNSAAGTQTIVTIFTGQRQGLPYYLIRHKTPGKNHSRPE
jgi:hypothetical protein